ncbi:MAG: carbonic anhydrase [Candidatus Binatales bacterium]
MKKFGAWLGVVAVVILIAPARAGAAPAFASANAAEALQRLLDGNQRYVAGRAIRPNQTAGRRATVAGGQHPFAAILGCSDSRVPPEIVFDQGLGDLFVVRLAGNVADPVALDSLDYAVTHLGTRLILVLGHERCGAVTAAVEGYGERGDVGPMLAELRPAVAASKALPGDPVANAIRANVELTVENLRTSKPLSAMVASGQLKIVGGIYHLATGKVEMLPATASVTH